MIKNTVVFLLLCAGVAHADCGPQQQTFMSCQIEGQSEHVSVCFDDDVAEYVFGPEGQPELSLSEPVQTLSYTPWPGVGRSIWEDVTFRNGAYTYTVFGGFDRMFGDETEEDHAQPFFGGVHVRRGDVSVAELTCDRTTVDFAWGGGLWDAKQAAGMTWNFETRQWEAASE
ncbi:MAG: hypothetical protein AAFN63_01135 [Pseudomonadota bacterium]